MKKTLLVMAMAIALVLSMMATAVADSHVEITSPTAGEVVYEDTLYLEATATADTSVNVAVRETTEADDNCMWGTDNVLYRDVSGTLSTDSDGVYTDTVDISGAEPGLYCFAFDPADAPRISVKFYIVGDYAKVGGVIDLSDDGGPSKGNGTHAIEGVVGNAGSYGTVGSITVNYRELDEYKTYDAESLTLFAPEGIGIFDDEVAAHIDTEDGGRFYVLDRDADSDDLVAPRGAIQFFPVWEDGKWSGYEDSDYAINATPPDTGADSWVPMLRGNNHVGTR